MFNVKNPSILEIPSFPSNEWFLWSILWLVDLAEYDWLLQVSDHIVRWHLFKKNSEN